MPTAPEVDMTARERETEPPAAPRKNPLTRFFTDFNHTRHGPPTPLARARTPRPARLSSKMPKRPKDEIDIKVGKHLPRGPTLLKHFRKENKIFKVPIYRYEG